MKTTITNAMLCTLIHITKNQIELKRNEITQLSQYTTKVIRESYNDEVSELVAIKDFLVSELQDSKVKTTNIEKVGVLLLLSPIMVEI